MARSDLLVSLVRAAVAGDRARVRATAEALAADERAKNHHLLADRLQQALAAVSLSNAAFGNTATAASGKEAILEITPRTRLDELLLTLPVREAARQLVEEHARADVLRAHGLEPRHRVLLSGPPGNGKTSFAEAIAEALALPMFVVRYDVLVGSYLGETNARLRRLFDYARTTPCILFFDEFDALGKERGDIHETGEIKRVVSFLLVQIDQLPSWTITVAATNHAELLDRAVWRRFQLRLAFPAPGPAEIAAFLAKQMERWPQRPSLSPERIAQRLGAPSYAEARDFCLDVRRRVVLGLGEVGVDAALEAELRTWEARVRPESGDGGGTVVSTPARRARRSHGKKESEAAPDTGA
ncbi:MAG: ATP-binding protein [Geminicoccaceae bacterium]|nr:ATP-binding protein [Geminicoccaceae bacterium]